MKYEENDAAASASSAAASDPTTACTGLNTEASQLATLATTSVHICVNFMIILIFHVKLSHSFFFRRGTGRTVWNQLPSTHF